jgi:hypothetical protein
VIMYVESNQRTCEDDDIVGHAKVRRSEIDEHGRSVDRYGHPAVLLVGSTHWQEPLSIKRTGIMMAGGKSHPRCASGGCSVYRKNTSVTPWRS